jgi:hypothetical protein
MKIVNSKSNYVHVKTMNGHTTRRKGDIDPKLIADFVTIPWKWRDCSLLDTKLYGWTVFYIIELEEYNGSYEVGVTTELGTRLYHYGGWYKSIPKGKSRFRYIKLTSANSCFKIERFILFYAFFKGYKVDVGGVPLHGECIKRSDEIVKDLLRFTCLMNKNGGCAKVQLNDSQTTYFLNNKWCDGRGTGTKSYLGNEGIGQYNMAEHQEYHNFLANLGRDEE